MAKSTASSPTIFGIRHHGPGSARSLRRALEQLRPDAILVEGPPEADDLLPLIAHAEMRPPVALLLYVPDQPQHAVFYPFAVFSPEWQALLYGVKHDIPVRFMDLPQTHQLAIELKLIAALTAQREQQEASSHQPSANSEPQAAIYLDPLQYLAEAAGYQDGERWWEHMVEQRRDARELFAAILEAMTALREALREELPDAPNPIGPQREREAYMRQTIRAAQREGYERIAVVCGAWHAPAVAKLPPAKEDAALLKGLPKIKIEATWTPWTYSRLSYHSGYGAGIESPGWYDHLWTTRDHVTIRWLTKVARLLRKEDLDASSAHIIEAVRLAETLAALRQRPIPGLPEMNDAAQTVFCFGNDLPLQLIHTKLIVGETLGRVPAATPMPPLQRDLEREQKRLRLPADVTQRTLDLDLRQPLELDRSRLLHRLRLLNIPWGAVQRTGKVKGTFHELWQIQWQPEFVVGVIEAGVWGNTVLKAATTFASDKATKATDLPTLTQLVDRVLLADLSEAVPAVMDRVQAEAAVASDVQHLMAALPPLVNVLRYGNVRQTDLSAVNHIVAGLIARMVIGLPGACASLNDEAAATMLKHLTDVHHAIGILQNDAYTSAWHGVLKQLSDQQGLHGLIAGRCCRLLLNQGQLTASDAAQHMSLALSTANEPTQAAAWIEGFLRGSGLLLLHDEALWRVIDEWLVTLSADAFTQLLPLLRRTFSTFSRPERTQMGEKVKQGAGNSMQPHGGASREAGSDTQRSDFDVERAEKALPLVMKLLGLEHDANR
ncbi:hypothetical protein TFLX_04699 [Thermoflexales bacterium]|nr:hypothetical protein TFLX_04699 [Thermoflexales bacterium]